MKRRHLSLWLPVAGYMGLLFFLSSLSRVPLVEHSWDKALHVVAYGLLGGLTLRATHGGLDRLRPVAAMAGVALAIGYGIADEIHQSFVPGREPSAGDLLADAIGVASAAVAFFWLGRGRVRGQAHGSGPEVVFVEGAECHLCHEALAQLERVREEIPFRLVRLNADRQALPAGVGRSDIPVVFVDGEILCKHRVDPERLRRALRARARG